jgi:hypothetical protein
MLTSKSVKEHMTNSHWHSRTIMPFNADYWRTHAAAYIIHISCLKATTKLSKIQPTRQNVGTDVLARCRPLWAPWKVSLNTRHVENQSLAGCQGCWSLLQLEQQVLPHDRRLCFEDDNSHETHSSPTDEAIQCQRTRNCVKHHHDHTHIATTRHHSPVERRADDGKSGPSPAQPSPAIRGQA